LADRKEWGTIEAVVTGTVSLEAAHAKVVAGYFGPSKTAFLPRRIGPLYLYAIRRPDAHEVKIGISRDVAARLMMLQRHHGSPLELAAIWEAGRDYEAAMHERFASARKLGEWFHETPEITAWIDGAVGQGVAA
jgi:hypothetical protein